VTDRKTDGTGAPLEPTGLYYVQDTRQVVGNCGLFWRADRAGYSCNVTEFGKYTGEEVSRMRETDVPWPIAHVEANVVRHVRVDLAAFTRNDDIWLRMNNKEDR
jgi:hypothetical protein